MKLHNLKRNDKSKSNKRLGRGVGSGRGKTSGKGHKGLKARPGHANKRGFEGGQMPLYRRLPKKGFTNIFRVPTKIINLDQLNQFNEGDEISPEVLKTKGLYPSKYKRLKILGHGSCDKKLVIEAHAFSKSAREKLKNCTLKEI